MLRAVLSSNHVIEHNSLGLQHNNEILQASAGFQMAKFDFISEVKDI